MATVVVNTAAGPTAPIQWTDSGGGTAVTWWTPQLTAITFAGLVKCRIYALESNALANCCIGVEIAVTASDGSSPVVWGIGKGVAEVGTAAAAMVVYVAGIDTSISDGQRLRIRIFIDDFQAAMATAYTATLTIGTTDTSIVLPVTLVEFVGSTGIPIVVMPPMLPPDGTQL